MNRIDLLTPNHNLTLRFNRVPKHIRQTHGLVSSYFNSTGTEIETIDFLRNLESVLQTLGDVQMLMSYSSRKLCWQCEVDVYTMNCDGVFDLLNAYTLPLFVQKIKSPCQEARA